MRKTTTSREQIINETRHISKCAGLLCGRILLLVCLFFLFIPFNATALYIFAFFFIVPWLLNNTLNERKTAEPIILNSCAKKFHYTSIHFTVERNIGRAAVLILAAWQFYVPRSIAIYLQLAPGILLLLYLLCRIISTIIIRHYIHSYYMELRSLEQGT